MREISLVTMVLFNVKTKHHKTLVTHATTPEDAIEMVKEFIRQTPLYTRLGDECFEDMTAEFDRVVGPVVLPKDFLEPVK